MQLGCCCPIEQSDIARRAGFDFVEPTVLSLQAADSTVDFQAVLSRFQALALPTSSFNIFLPATLSVCGPSVDWSAVEAYVKEALRRVQAVGGKCVVFGSAASRQAPDGFDRSEAEDQLVRFLRIAGAIAEPLELTIVIEPLNTEETNTINSVTEGAAFARKADHPAVRLLADLYHMQVEHEPLDHLAQCGEWIHHIHVADSGRYAPGTGTYPFGEFLSILHAINYTGPIAVECTWRDFEVEAPQTVNFMRDVWLESGK